MTIATKIIFIAALILSIIIPFGYYLIGEKTKSGTNARSVSMHFSSSVLLPLLLLPCWQVLTASMQPQPQPMVRLSPQAWATLQQHS